MKRTCMGILGLLVIAAIAIGGAGKNLIWMGKQPDGSYLVSSGQRIEGDALAFTGRPLDLARQNVTMTGVIVRGQIKGTRVRGQETGVRRQESRDRN